MNRVSTNQFSYQALRSMHDRMSNMAQYQQQISTGEKATQLSDAPFDVAMTGHFESLKRENAQHLDNIGAVQSRMNLQEVSLTDMSSTLRRVRDLTVRAGSGALSAQDHAVIGIEIRELGEHLVSLANTRDAAGQYAFAGFDGSRLPVAHETDGDNDYIRVSHEQMTYAVEVGERVQMTTGLLARDLFGQVSTGWNTHADPDNTGTLIATPPVEVSAGAVVPGETYTLRFSSATQYDVLDSSNAVVSAAQTYVAGSDITVGGHRFAIKGEAQANDEIQLGETPATDLFSSLFRLAHALQDDSLTDAQRDTAIESGHSEIDASFLAITQGLGILGARLATAERLEQTNLDYEVYMDTKISQYRDVDMAEAITNLQRESTLLEAVQSSFSRVAQLSLFNYL